MFKLFFEFLLAFASVSFLIAPSEAVIGELEIHLYNAEEFLGGWQWPKMVALRREPNGPKLFIQGGAASSSPVVYNFGPYWFTFVGIDQKNARPTMLTGPKSGKIWLSLAGCALRQTAAEGKGSRETEKAAKYFADFPDKCERDSKTSPLFLEIGEFQDLRFVPLRCVNLARMANEKREKGKNELKFSFLPEDSNFEKFRISLAIGDERFFEDCPEN